MKSEGFINFRGYKTWYSVYGDLTSGITPLVLLHGGPGYPHQHLQNLSELSRQGIPVVLYDQLGCGNSDKPDDINIYTIQLFIDELNEVRNSLNLNKVNILGHSWGGTLAIEYALTNPRGLEKLILSSPLIDTKIWVEEADKLKDQLPKEIAETMRKHEKDMTTDSREYGEAVEVFNKHFVCRLNPKPQDIIDCENAADSRVYNIMWGPSEAHATGKLKNWTSLSRLDQIKVPTLILSGKYDEATPRQMQMAEYLIPNVKRITFMNSSHTANYEDKQEYFAAVLDFIG